MSKNFKNSLYSLLFIFASTLFVSITASIVSASKGTELMKLKSEIVLEKEQKREFVQEIANKTSLSEIQNRVENHMEEPSIESIEYLQ